MRTTSNIHNAIVVPGFVNMTAYNDSFKFTISLNISEYVSMIIHKYCGDSLAPICIKGKYYLHWEKFFSWGKYDEELKQAVSNIPFACQEAYRVLKHMKIAIREAKIQELNDEIDTIKYYD